MILDLALINSLVMLSQQKRLSLVIESQPISASLPRRSDLLTPRPQRRFQNKSWWSPLAPAITMITRPSAKLFRGRQPLARTALSDANWSVLLQLRAHFSAMLQILQDLVSIRVNQTPTRSELRKLSVAALCSSPNRSVMSATKPLKRRRRTTQASVKSTISGPTQSGRTFAKRSNRSTIRFLPLWLQRTIRRWLSAPMRLASTKKYWMRKLTLDLATMSKNRASRRVAPLWELALRQEELPIQISTTPGVCNRSWPSSRQPNLLWVSVHNQLRKQFKMLLLVQATTRSLILTAGSSVVTTWILVRYDRKTIFEVAISLEINIHLHLISSTHQ